MVNKEDKEEKKVELTFTKLDIEYKRFQAGLMEVVKDIDPKGRVHKYESDLGDDVIYFDCYIEDFIINIGIRQGDEGHTDMLLQPQRHRVLVDRVINRINLRSNMSGVSCKCNVYDIAGIRDKNTEIINFVDRLKSKSTFNNYVKRPDEFPDMFKRVLDSVEYFILVYLNFSGYKIRSFSLYDYFYYNTDLKIFKLLRTIDHKLSYITPTLFSELMTNYHNFIGLYYKFYTDEDCNETANANEIIVRYLSVFKEIITKITRVSIYRFDYTIRNLKYKKLSGSLKDGVISIVRFPNIGILSSLREILHKIDPLSKVHHKVVTDGHKKYLIDIRGEHIVIELSREKNRLYRFNTSINLEYSQKRFATEILMQLLERARDTTYCEEGAIKHCLLLDRLESNNPALVALKDFIEANERLSEHNHSIYDQTISFLLQVMENKLGSEIDLEQVFKHECIDNPLTKNKISVKEMKILQELYQITNRYISNYNFWTNAYGETIGFNSNLNKVFNDYRIYLLKKLYILNYKEGKTT